MAAIHYPGNTHYGSGICIGADSTTALLCKAFHTVTSTWSNSSILAGGIAELTIASTTADVNPGDLVNVDGDLAADVILNGFRLSTVAASRLTAILVVPGSTGSSTLSGTLRITWADLT